MMHLMKVCHVVILNAVIMIVLTLRVILIVIVNMIAFEIDNGLKIVIESN